MSEKRLLAVGVLSAVAILAIIGIVAAMEAPVDHVAQAIGSTLRGRPADADLTIGTPWGLPRWVLVIDNAVGALLLAIMFLGGLPLGVVALGLHLRLGGLDATRRARQTHVDWLLLNDISLGDEFAIRVTRASRANRPIRRELAASQERTKQGIEVRRCSLCGRLRPQKRGEKPNVALGANGAACRQCLVVAGALLESKATNALHLTRARGGSCSFCARPRPAVVVRGKEGGICSACVASINTAF